MIAGALDPLPERIGGDSLFEIEEPGERVMNLHDAAELCDTSYTALRKRADRGTLRTVKVGKTRMVPRSELERAGLLPGAEERRLAARVAELEAEIRTVRLLTERAESELEAERDARTRAESAMHEHRAVARAAAAQSEAAAADLEAGRIEMQRVKDAAAGPLGPVRAWRAARTIKV